VVLALSALEPQAGNCHAAESGIVSIMELSKLMRREGRRENGWNSKRAEATLSELGIFSMMEKRKENDGSTKVRLDWLLALKLHACRPIRRSQLLPILAATPQKA
jgi:adenine C2-methylase RlmN of 23S rRNA A2503 and tRNA A37